MNVKLHRCPNVWLKLRSHPCWRVQRELDAAGIDYEIVRGPRRQSRRNDLEELSGQRLYPAIEFSDGRVYRAESTEMAERIRSGALPLWSESAHPGHDVHDRAQEAHPIDTESL